jgi:COP9 signalosome complex subunit 4
VSNSEALSSLRSQLTSLSGGGVSHRDLGERYRAILDSILTWKETDLVEGLKAFIEAIINENVSLVISRQLLSEVGQHLSKMADDAVSKAVSHYTLDVVQPRVISFEDQVRHTRAKTN